MASVAFTGEEPPVALTQAQHQGGPQVDVEHHVVGAGLEAGPHVVLGHASQTVQSQGDQLGQGGRRSGRHMVTEWDGWSMNLH